MRAGRLNTLVSVLVSGQAPKSAWVEWLPSVPGSAGPLTGLQQPEPVVLRHRNLPPLVPGNWVDYNGRLLRVGFTGRSDKVRNAFESVCTEYAGTAATYTPAGGSAIDVRVFIERDLEYIGEVGRIAETRHRIEVLQFELDGHQPASGDWVTVGSEQFTVEGLAPGVDDGVLFQLVAS